MLDMEIIGQVLTTLITFAIFFLILKKLFWAPMQQTVDARQSKIKGEFDRIESMQAQVDALQADYSKRLADIEAEARQHMQEAIAQGRQIAEQIGVQARKDAEATQQKNQQMLAIEMEKARAELKQEVVKMTIAATEKIIRQQMNDTRQRELVSTFVEELARK
ncbi:MAG: F0F1 ATP synthase subunit B [Candidatus Sumerlaeaceae bacterium]